MATSPLTRRMSVGARDSAGVAPSAGVDTLAPVPLDVVTPRSGSGVATRLRDAVLVLDRHELVFALGKFAVVHNVPRQELTLLSGQQPSAPSTQPPSSSTSTHRRQTNDHSSAALGAITAMTLDGKRAHISICREAVGTGVGATVSIHSLKGSASSSAGTGQRQRGARLKTLRFGGAERFRGVAMSSDGKIVCCQCANASWTLVVWDWSRERQIAVSDVHCKVTRVRFNVIDMAQISTSGGNQLKLWTLSEYTLKSFASFKSGDETRMRHRIASYADHVWLPDDCLVALLDDGSVQLIINGELVQTTQALASGSRAYCITTQNNGEAGVMVGGSDGTVAFLRIISKLMRAGEKEMHLQRRISMSNVQHIYGMGVDATGSVLVCSTDLLYGSYDLSNQCLLLGEDEHLSLSPLASTPYVTQIKGRSLCGASRRPCFASIGKLPNGEDCMFVWNQMDGHECFLTQTFDAHSSPTCMDIHPTGAELVVAFSSKVTIFFLLQDSVKVGFELVAKHVSHVAYSSSGTHLIIAQSATRKIMIYRSFCRYQREPELVATYQGVEESIECLGWSLNDRSFFYCDGGNQGEIRHCRLLPNDSGDIEEALMVQSTTKLLSRSQKCVDFTTCKLQHDSHDYVLFGVEQESTVAHSVTSSETSRTSSILRAWLNGDLNRDSLTSGTGAGLRLNHDVTVISAGPGNMLIAGTAQGVLILLYWRQGRLNPDGTRNVFVMATQRHVDMHAAAVVGLVYCRGTRSLLSTDDQGVVLVSSIKRVTETEGTEQQRRALIAQVGTKSSADDDVVFSDPSQTFVSVCQADEIAIYDRNSIELRKLKQMDVEGELQQVKLENEMLSKQLQDQKRGLEERLKSELDKYSAHSEARENALKEDWESRLVASDANRQTSIARLRQDAQLARDQYVASTDKLQAECERLRRQLLASQQAVEDLRLGSEEQQSQLRVQFEKKLQDAAISRKQESLQLQAELQETRSKLREALVQQDQDQMTQLSILSSNVDQEKARASEQLSQIQGKMAALHQEVKMLLAALNQKDHELHLLREKHDRDVADIANLKDQLRREKDRLKLIEREKQELLAEANEQKLIRDNLQRLNNVHRSQIEMLQKNLLPKERELEQMQQHMNQLHTVNQEVVVQANLSDRLRKESSARAKQNEVDVKETHDLLEHVRNSVVVLQDELGELVRQSAVQEKCTIVGEIMRIHKRITRQMDVLQARDGRAEEVSAELHRQNRFLLKNKQHLRHQADISHKEKHKLVSALSFQNATLMNDINVLRRENKELTRMLGRLPKPEQEQEIASTPEEANKVEEEFDARRFHATKSPATSTSSRPSSASSTGPTRLQQIARRSSIRPKSAAAARPKR